MIHVVGAALFVLLAIIFTATEIRIRRRVRLFRRLQLVTYTACYLGAACNGVCALPGAPVWLQEWTLRGSPVVVALLTLAIVVAWVKPMQPLRAIGGRR